MPDIQFENHGSIILMRAKTPQGKAWVDDNVDTSNAQTWNGATVVEPRYADLIAFGAEADGLAVELQ